MSFGDTELWDVALQVAMEVDEHGLRETTCCRQSAVIAMAPLFCLLRACRFCDEALSSYCDRRDIT